MVYKNRHRLKEKEVERYSEEIEKRLGDTLFERDSPVDTADLDGGRAVLIVDDEIMAAFFDNKVFPTINGLLQMEPTKAYVTVDMGAVKFVYNGADIMAPGIVDADEDIELNQLVWVREVEHEKPLAVGRALTDGRTMIESDSGKVVKSLHHVGDGIFQ